MRKETNDTSPPLTITRDGVYSLREVARYFKASYGTVYKMARSGDLKTFRVGTGYKVAGSTILDMMGMGDVAS